MKPVAPQKEKKTRTGILELASRQTARRLIQLARPLAAQLSAARADMSVENDESTAERKAVTGVILRRITPFRPPSASCTDPRKGPASCAVMQKNRTAVALGQELRNTPVLFAAELLPQRLQRRFL